MLIFPAEMMMGLPSPPIGVLFSNNVNQSTGRASGDTLTIPGSQTSLVIAFWFRGVSTATQRIFDNYQSTGGINIILDSTNGVNFIVWHSGGVSSTITTAGFTARSDFTKWHHFLVFIRPSSATGSRFVVYVDGVRYLNGAAITGGGTMAITEQTTGFSLNTASGAYVGSADGSTSQLSAGLAELWIDYGTLTTFTGVIDKFIAGGRPVDLGESGEHPSGAAPEFYFSARTSIAQFSENRGSAGIFTPGTAALGAVVPAIQVGA